jgi:hypothetical protein
MIDAIMAWLVGTAILALPVSLAAKITKVRLDGYGWAFIATLLVLIVQTVIGVFISSAIIGLPIAIISSVAIFSLALGASWLKAVLILVILAFMAFALGFVVVQFLGGHAMVGFYGHDFSFGTP